MSAEKHLNDLDIWNHPRITNRNETESYDVSELMESYHQQQMQEELEEAEKERAEECKICSCQPPYTRCYGFNDAIRHLKETNKGYGKLR